MKTPNKKPAIRGWVEFREKGNIKDVKAKKAKVKAVKRHRLT